MRMDKLTAKFQMALAHAQSLASVDIGKGLNWQIQPVICIEV